MFNGIRKDNMIYDVIDEGVFGTDMLAVGTWKFDTETGTMALFHSNNKDLLAKETAGMTYLPQGLREDSIPVYMEGLNEEVRFTLDLGYAGILEINNALADRLKTYFSYEEEITQHGERLTDTLSIFKIPIRIVGTRVDSCEVQPIVADMFHQYAMIRLCEEYIPCSMGRTFTGEESIP